MFRDRTRLSSIHGAKVPRRSVLHERENRDGLRFSVRDAEGEEEEEEEEEEKAESHCFSCRGNPFVGALQSSVLIRPSTPSSLIVQLRLLHVRALVECLDFSTTLESTLQAAAESPPGHARAPSKRRQLVSHWPIPRTPSWNGFAKELNQNNKQTEKRLLSFVGVDGVWM